MKVTTKTEAILPLVSQFKIKGTQGLRIPNVQYLANIPLLFKFLQ